MAKKSKVVALLLAIFLSLWVWLYLNKYKKFFICLSISIFFPIVALIGLIIINPILIISMVVLMYVSSLIIWIMAIVDAVRVKQK